MSVLLIFLATALISYLGVFWFERWSRKRDLLDIPNERSSHDKPTPRGGGIVIVALTLLAYVISDFLYGGSISWSFVLGGLLIAAISWLDDVRSVSFIFRFLVHSVAAALVLVELGYSDKIDLPLATAGINLGVLGVGITFFWIVWVINAYNFMDGIDGIAGIQAMATSCGWLLVSMYIGDWQSAALTTAVFGSSLGFLIHNWHPARVFMGDVGSAFLGFTFAVLPLTMAHGSATFADRMPILGILFLWPFLFDTLLTLLRRVFRGEKVWTAHRDHLYQQMVRSSFKHNVVSKIYGLTSSLIVAAAVVGLIYGGRFEILTAVITISTTAVLVLASRWKKRLT